MGSGYRITVEDEDGDDVTMFTLDGDVTSRLPIRAGQLVRSDQLLELGTLLADAMKSWDAEHYPEDDG